jgi:hypothetical protein
MLQRMECSPFASSAKLHSRSLGCREQGSVSTARDRTERGVRLPGVQNVHASPGEGWTARFRPASDTGSGRKFIGHDVAFGRNSKQGRRGAYSFIDVVLSSESGEVDGRVDVLGKLQGADPRHRQLSDRRQASLGPCEIEIVFLRARLSNDAQKRFNLFSLNQAFVDVGLVGFPTTWPSRAAANANAASSSLSSSSFTATSTTYTASFAVASALSLIFMKTVFMSASPAARTARSRQPHSGSQSVPQVRRRIRWSH